MFELRFVLIAGHGFISIASHFLVSLKVVDFLFHGFEEGSRLK